ncbi:Subtilase family protein [Duganella sp. CF402]|uniref:S8 family serine peptidase n=1 Tax=unclassified Duganella TaxID=2636909 RepID=UPI0008D68AE3|nr:MULTISPECIES: S8 family serine peptidase [unclassified Duganella]RZT08660.1 subtilase family protein [Duganella sp. BK701]SEL86171.1 Subtilase family protein [Duganella sp. CF402]
MPIRSLLVATICLLGTADASAQLRLPNLPLPQLPLNTPLLRDTGRLLDRTDVGNLVTSRLEQVAGLLRQHRDLLEADPRGEAVVRHEILAWSPSEAGLAAARAAGLVIVDAQAGASTVVMRVPGQLDTAAMLARLRELDPDGVYDFNHIYTGSAAQPAEQPAGGAQALPHAANALKVGLVDSGIAREHEVFERARILPWGCDGKDHPSAHGTAVAALMVGRSDRFRGVAPQAALYAADIYCDSATGGSASRIAAALDWLAREQVAVINLSLVGPPNQILERVVAGMIKRGHLLVAAVGNDGPAAAPLYPASYPGVVGVSGVDKRGQPLPEAARGPQVMFAAPGNQMVSAAIGSQPYRTVRGTSFASPIVAALLADGLRQPSPAGAAQALATAMKSAAGNASGVPNPEVGYGVLGAAHRVDPSAFR